MQLALISIGGSISHSTFGTQVEGLGRKDVVKKESIIDSVPIGHKGKIIDFQSPMALYMTIP